MLFEIENLNLQTHFQTNHTVDILIFKLGNTLNDQSDRYWGIAGIDCWHC